jgi:hypothetical protein
MYPFTNYKKRRTKFNHETGEDNKKCHPGRWIKIEWADHMIYTIKPV